MIDKLNISKPTKFVIGIRNAGLDTCNAQFKGQFENSNPIDVSMQVVNLMGNQFAGEKNKCFYEYWLACSILNRLEFDKEKLLRDINTSTEVIKNFDLNNLGIEKNERKNK